MEIDSLLQLLVLLRALLLGWVLGLLYDLLRALRRRLSAEALYARMGISIRMRPSAFRSGRMFFCRKTILSEKSNRQKEIKLPFCANMVV